MDTALLSLEHAAFLKTRLASLNLQIAEYTFANLYLFRALHRYELLFLEDTYIKGITHAGQTYLMVLTPPEKIRFAELKALAQTVDFIFPIPSQWEAAFIAQGFTSWFLEQDSDYLFTSEKLSLYPGRHLSGRRNLVKQFKQLYPTYESRLLDATHLAQAHQVLETWHATATSQGQLIDYQACQEALDLFEKLQLSGFLVTVEQQPIGFLIGEPLNDETYVIHFAKALTTYKGIYQYLYQEFAKILQSTYRVINLEQDLGLADLQHAKRAYQPDCLPPKLRLKLK